MRGMDGGKLSEVMPGLSLEDNELVSKFKMAASDLVSVRGQVMEYIYIPTGIKGEMVRSGVDCDWIQPPGGTFHKLSSDAIFVVFSQTFALF